MPHNAEALSPAAGEQVKRQKGFAHTQLKGDRASCWQGAKFVSMYGYMYGLVYNCYFCLCAGCGIKRWTQWRFFRPSAFKQIKYDTLAFHPTDSILVVPYSASLVAFYLHDCSRLSCLTCATTNYYTMLSGVGSNVVS